MKVLLGLVLATTVAMISTTQAATPRGDEPSKAPKIKLVGCLEHDNPASSAAARNASEITAFRLGGVDPNAAKSAGALGTDLTAVRLRADDEFELFDRVGRTVEVTGRFVQDEAGTPESAKLMVVSAQGVLVPLPILYVTSVHTLSHSCH